jgi:hypothetical protein
VVGRGELDSAVHPTFPPAGPVADDLAGGGLDRGRGRSTDRTLTGFGRPVASPQSRTQRYRQADEAADPCRGLNERDLEGKEPRHGAGHVPYVLPRPADRAVVLAAD